MSGVQVYTLVSPSDIHETYYIYRFLHSGDASLIVVRPSPSLYQYLRLLCVMHVLNPSPVAPDNHDPVSFGMALQPLENFA